MKYDFAAIEKKWQEKWEQEKPYAAVTGDKKPKFYGLIEFPYPSAAGLHVGHPRPFTAMDIICRKKRMQGYNVLNPIGFDAFGLPTENFAIKNHIHPAIVTKKNIENFTRQLKMLGYSFDWDRVVDTTDPNYYRWTQWIFLQMYKHGLAYKTTMPVNWCTSCKCVLANEEVVEGVCERCGAPVIRKEKSQWMLRITKYADRLIDDLDGLDYIERVKTQQKNWIGRSTGTEVTFKTNTEEGDVYRPQPREKQMEALKFVERNILIEPTWLRDLPYAKRLTSDPNTLTNGIATMGVARLVGRLGYLNDLYKGDEYLADLSRMIMKDVNQRDLSPYRKTLQTQYINSLIGRIDTDNAKIRPFALQTLKQLQRQLATAQTPHATALKDAIDRALVIK